jgi:hypothetical protein
MWSCMALKACIVKGAADVAVHLVCQESLLRVSDGVIDVPLM